MLSGASLTGDNALIQYFRWVSRSDLLPLFSDATKVEIFKCSSENIMMDYLKSCQLTLANWERCLLWKKIFLADHNLIYTDKMSMATGVEVRVPFLDQELIEFASKIPDRYKLRLGQEKWILKKVMEKHLPRNLIYRRKTGFGAPVRRWIKNELNRLLRTLSEESLRKDKFLMGRRLTI